jgi:hypothetical protein
VVLANTLSVLIKFFLATRGLGTLITGSNDFIINSPVAYDDENWNIGI